MAEKICNKGVGKNSRRWTETVPQTFVKVLADSENNFTIFKRN